MAETITSGAPIRFELSYRDGGSYISGYRVSVPCLLRDGGRLAVREDCVTTDDIEKVAGWLFDLGVWTPESRETFPFHDAATELLGLVLGDSEAVA